MAQSLIKMSLEDKAPLVPIDDIRRFECVPIEERIAEQSIYDLVRSAAETWGEAPFLKFLEYGLADDEPKTLSFKDLLAQVTKAANAFRKLGIGRDDAVGFLAPNLPETYVCMLAASTAGRTNPVNPLLSEDHICNIMQMAGVKVIITVSSAIDSDVYNKALAVAEVLPQDVTIITLDAQDEGAIGYAELIAEVPADSLTDIKPPKPGHIASTFHTGGTTSAPKLIAMSHYNQLATTCMGLLGSGYETGDVSLAGLPSYHVIAGIATPLISLAAGATILLCGPHGYRNPFMVGDFWKIVAKHKVTSAAVVPTVVGILKDIPIDGDISSLKQIVSGAAPLPVALIDAISAKVDAEIVETYGMTEASTFCARNPVGGEKRPGSVGPFAPYQEARIVIDVDHRPYQNVKDGEVGKILVRDPNVVSSTAYATGELQSTSDERVDEDGWLDTGDLGRVDGDGYVWLQGRAKDLIIRSGHNIDPRLIEEALSHHPAVNMVAAVGQPDGYAGEIPKAFVTLNAGSSVSEDELLDYAREHVSERPAAPAEVTVLEALPLTAIGKVYKPALRALAAEGVAIRLLNEALSNDAQIEVQARECAPGATRPVEVVATGLSRQGFAEFRLVAEAQLAALNIKPLLTNESAV